MKKLLLFAVLSFSMAVVGNAYARNYLDEQFDRYGCNETAGYRWCPYYERCIRRSEEICQGETFGQQYWFQRPAPRIVDTHGCVTSDSEKWCQSLNRCIRNSSERCKPTPPAGEFDYSFVHGYSVSDCWSSVTGLSTCRIRSNCFWK